MKFFTLLNFAHYLKYTTLLLAVTSFLVLAEEEMLCNSMVEKTMLDEEVSFYEERALRQRFRPINP